MKIAVIGAAGRLGSLLIREGLLRGHEMTAVVRDVYIVPNPRVGVIECDVHDLTPEDVLVVDAVIDAFGVWKTEKAAQHVTSLLHLADILSGSGVRLLVAGTAGNLYLDEAQTTRIIDLPDFPKGAYPVVFSMCEAYDLLCERQDLRWTYFSPAPDFRADAEKAGHYRIAGEMVPRNRRGKSEVTYADFADAILDEAEQAAHINERITVYTA